MFTVTVAGSASTPTGTVTFKDGATTLGAVTLDGSGQAPLTNSSLSVADGLKLHSGLALRFVSPGPGAELERSVQNLLTETFGAGISNLQVKARADGQVTVTGNTGSLAEQLHVSQCLRRVKQCSCVVNQLSISGTPAERPMPSPSASSPLSSHPVVLPVPEPMPLPVGAQRVQEATAPPTPTPAGC